MNYYCTLHSLQVATVVRTIIEWHPNSVMKTILPIVTNASFLGFSVDK